MFVTYRTSIFFTNSKLTSRGVTDLHAILQEEAFRMLVYTCERLTVQLVKSSIKCYIGRIHKTS